MFLHTGYKKRLIIRVAKNSLFIVVNEVFSALLFLLFVFSLTAFTGSILYPMDFELHQGGDAANSQERTSVRDWDERGTPTQMRLERRRVIRQRGLTYAYV
jgi:hypothetical protein